MLFVGDLNFRIHDEPMAVLERVAESYSIRTGKSTKVDIRLHGISDISTMKKCPADPAPLEDKEKSEEEDSENVWKWIDDLDELKVSMKAGEIFSGFTEASIQWAPSFRWKRGTKAKSFGDVQELAKCYTLAVKGKDGAVEKRTPRFVVE